MKALYVEPFAGISGNMLLGALLDAGVPFAFLQEEFAKLHLGNYELVHKSVNKSGIQAQYFNVVLPEEQEHEHEHAHDGDHVHEHHHAHDHVKKNLAVVTIIMTTNTIMTKNIIMSTIHTIITMNTGTCMT